MKLIYATSINFPSKFANRWQTITMAKEFHRRLGDDFCLGGRRIEYDGELPTISFWENRSWKLAFKYLKLVKDKNISHVYCREMRLLLLIIIYNKLFFRLKLNFIYEIHALLERNIKDKIINYVLSRYCDRYIFITEKLRQIYLEKHTHIKYATTLVAPDGVDMAVFDLDVSKSVAREKLRLPEDKIIIGYCGTFKTMGMDKGISDIIKSLKLLSGHNLLFVAVGGSNDDIDYYKQQASDLGVQKMSSFFGTCDQNDLALYQKAFDALLMPFPFNQHYAYYMSPLKMFEYMAAKRPIITSDLPSIREVLNDKNALFCQPDNPVDLAKKIDLLVGDNNLQEKLSSQAYQDVDKYIWSNRVGDIITFVLG